MRFTIIWWKWRSWRQKTISTWFITTLKILKRYSLCYSNLHLKTTLNIYHYTSIPHLISQLLRWLQIGHPMSCSTSHLDTLAGVPAWTVFSITSLSNVDCLKKHLPSTSSSRFQINESSNKWGPLVLSNKNHDLSAIYFPLHHRTRCCWRLDVGLPSAVVMDVTGG